MIFAERRSCVRRPRAGSDLNFGRPTSRSCNHALVRKRDVTMTQVKRRARYAPLAASTSLTPLLGLHQVSFYAAGLRTRSRTEHGIGRALKRVDELVGEQSCEAKLLDQWFERSASPR
jgi:hypothetical protein